MTLVAIKMLLGDRMKYLALVAGLAFAALLITQQAAIFAGYALQTTAWIRDTSQGDLWITDPQMEHADDIKNMTDTSLQRVRSVAGVEWAVPIYKGFLKARLQDGTLETVRVIGLDDATLMGGPPGMIEGDLAVLREDRAVIINERDTQQGLRLRRDASKRPMAVGDRMDINDNEVVVAGVYRKSAEFFWEPVIYTTYSRALKLAPGERKALTFVMAKVRPGENIAAVAKEISAQTGLLARTSAQFDSDTMWWIITKTGILINFGMTIALGIVIGVLVSALLLYTFVLENLRHFGALKAMGVTNLRLAWMVSVQVLLVGSIGYGLGLGASNFTGLFAASNPSIGLAFAMPWFIPVFGAVSILGCCLIAGFISLIRVLSLEPAIVFKS